MEIVYNDGLKSGDRSPRLYFKNNGIMTKFEGKSIPSVAVVLTAEYEKAGKWSNTTYRVELAKGVEHYIFLSPLHGIWGQEYISWLEVANHLGIGINEAKRVVGEEYPVTYQRLEDIEKISDTLPEDSDYEVITINFGSPTRREMSDGFWEKPKSLGDVTISLKDSDGGGGWNIENIDVNKGKILDCTRTPGMHGGYVSVRVMVFASE